ncbi:hypothetical protein PEL8287_01752 [Roseovarius litorisediminis]|uniref:Tetratricopeptide repeat-like domain-containing protein n=1 Tax=Roseovarius litorisediminis TaxID=1312363 RepID=A0A1Y5SCE1_9RHOB|nr:hypothetical protein [Roseovarius litorisediminis]SLN36782.1 hypothetical protein PEL8287_01752 [Roseovarius litorisediminis]
MSNTDSFIDEVTEEVRRDRLFRLFRRYGWIAVLGVFVLVGGAAWNEWRKAQDRQAAEDLGDAILASLENVDGPARAAALEAIEAPNATSQAVIDLLASSEEASQSPKDAATRLLALADRDGVPPIYRQIATLKATSIPESGLAVDERRARLEGLALSGGLTRLLAEEQLALIEVELGNNDAAIKRLGQIATDAEATAGLRRRATQVIVALGGDLPEVPLSE